MSSLNYQHFHLVGIKGVAMSALAQILFDMNKNVSGSDVAEDFVTMDQLKRIGVTIQTSFLEPLPDGTDCIIYTAAHQSKNNPQVQAAIKQGLPVYSHAEALGLLFQEKIGIAVCGVGGKSTISAMIAWVLGVTCREPAFAVGVGSIVGLEKTGSWSEQARYFVAEADEYVTDPTEVDASKRRPRFSYLKPKMIVCSNVLHDHPDVYADLDATKKTFTNFFNSLPAGGTLIIASATGTEYVLREDIKKSTYGTNDEDDFRLEKNTKVENRMIIGRLWHREESFELKLGVPGFFNLLNATAAFAASLKLDIPEAEILDALSSFRSTKRRFEYLGEKQGVRYYDDYAHHPSELKAVIAAFEQWEPDSRKVVAFQPHTFSRTKALFSEFVTALAGVKELILLDIYASAREGLDSSISSKILAEAVQRESPETKITIVANFQDLAEYFRNDLKSGDVCITLGAGDIYQAHGFLK
ncbi:MAG: UDP-N-acetylmuramate--L-alanine ligase [Candidatus Pacebacteria bacterium CG_4_10_14_0_8_um_filter_42_14]|nr:MAG: UDP-N-acetylmuramate--L-alanine ligase [Candidatus Pacebacteria bacterium CG_4_10_14_0_8_um_filter_42_14]